MKLKENALLESRFPQILSQPEYQWQRKYLSIISYLESSNSLEELFGLLRRKHRLTHEAVGKIINTDTRIVSRIEHNKRDLRSCEIIALAKFHEDFRLGAIAYLERLQSDKVIRGKNDY